MAYSRPGDQLLIVLFGPTSSGKTQLSVDLALKLHDLLRREPVIISADSRQVYRYMDIGTSKTAIEEMRGIRHEMLDIVEPMCKYELESYVAQARQHIKTCLDTQKIPIIVGGTGVYVKALLENWNVDETANIRVSLHRDFPRTFAHDAYAMLQRLDKAAANRIHPNNYDGIINALASAMVNSEHRQEMPTGIKQIVFGLDRTAKELDQRIAKTFDQQLNHGLFDEILSLNVRYELSDQFYRFGPNSPNQVLHTHGYREFFEFARDHGKLINTLSRYEHAEIRSRALEHLWAYAHRQRTFFPKLPHVQMIKNVEHATRLILQQKTSRTATRNHANSPQAKYEKGLTQNANKQRSSHPKKKTKRRKEF